MRRLHARLAAACALAVAIAIFTAGAAFAGGGNGKSGDPGNGNAYGHDNSGQAQQSQPSTQQQQQSSVHGSSSAGSSTDAGVKPSSSTTQWTHCTTGTSSGGTTCTSSDNGHTPQTRADVSKGYGNGKTAAQIAVTRGGVGVQLTGPGNSQPHKVSDCSHKSNRSGGVDVHAIKSYSASACASTGSQSADTSSKGQQQSSEKHEGRQKNEAPAQVHVTICHATGSPDTAGNGYVMISPSASGVYHGHYRRHGADIIPPFTYNGQTYSANWTATGEALFDNGCRPVVAAAAPTTVAPTVVAPTVVAPTTVARTTVAPTVPTVPATTVTTTAPTTTTAVTTVAQVTPTTTSSSGAGGVKGAVTTLKPRSSHHGVLGTVTHVAGSSLPFTGFPVWLAVLIALALILAGFALRRRTLSS